MCKKGKSFWLVWLALLGWAGPRRDSCGYTSRLLGIWPLVCAWSHVLRVTCTATHAALVELGQMLTSSSPNAMSELWARNASGFSSHQGTDTPRKHRGPRGPYLQHHRYILNVIGSRARVRRICKFTAVRGPSAEQHCYQEAVGRCVGPYAMPARD